MQNIFFFILCPDGTCKAHSTVHQVPLPSAPDIHWNVHNNSPKFHRSRLNGKEDRTEQTFIVCLFTVLLVSTSKIIFQET